MPTKVPTIEFRGADVMLSLGETVGYTGLVRAIVMQATKDVEASQINKRPERFSSRKHEESYPTSTVLVSEMLYVEMRSRSLPRVMPKISAA